MKMFSIYEDDLAKLERALPQLCDRAFGALNDPRVQVLFDECKEILSNVRWNYGPPTEVRRFPTGEQSESDSD